MQSHIPSLAQFISPHVHADVEAYRTSFLNADSFKYVAIDDFLDPLFAERLLSEFPAFRPELAKNEYGEVATKAVNTDIRAISPAYEELYSVIGSQPFLDLVSRLSGIPDLILDPKLYGGGTHENLHGQGMFTHVDFNYDESLNLHRRLNLLVYLNKDWKEEWGGSIELHSNPRRPKEDRVKAFLPIFNRCVMFETNEISWHGFRWVNLPPEERHRSRKSISIYLYTKDRPQDEIAPPHGTFYVHGPLPSRFGTGTVLTEDGVRELEAILNERDKYIDFYQKQELQRNADFARQSAYIRELISAARLPLTGYIRQDGPVRGFYPDGWVEPNLEVRLAPVEPVQTLIILGWRYDDAPGPMQVEVSISGQDPAVSTVGVGSFQVPVRLNHDRTDPFTVSIRSTYEARKASSGDNRELAFVVNEIRALHPKKRFSFLK